MPDACNGDEVIDLFWLTVNGDLSQFADSSTHPVVHFAQILTTIFPWTFNQQKCAVSQNPVMEQK